MEALAAEGNVAEALHVYSHYRPSPADLELIARSIKAGLVGLTPRLGDLVDGDLKWSIDFRRIDATLLDRWLGLPAETVLGRRSDHLPLLEA